MLRYQLLPEPLSESLASSARPPGSDAPLPKGLRFSAPSNGIAAVHGSIGPPLAFATAFGDPTSLQGSEPGWPIGSSSVSGWAVRMDPGCQLRIGSGVPTLTGLPWWAELFSRVESAPVLSQQSQRLLLRRDWLHQSADRSGACQQRRAAGLRSARCQLPLGQSGGYSGSRIRRGSGEGGLAAMLIDIDS